MRSTCSAVPARPSASSRSSVSVVATRVRARIFEYDSSPQASTCASRGSEPRARATRTCSRAAPGSSPTRQVSHAAHERKPWLQPPRASNSRIRSSSRAVAASRCADSSAISSPSLSSWTIGSGVGTTLGVQMFIGEPPGAAPTLYPGFRARVGAPGRTIARRSRIFSGDAGLARQRAGPGRWAGIRERLPRRRAGRARRMSMPTIRYITRPGTLTTPRGHRDVEETSRRPVTSAAPRRGTLAPAA